MNEIPSVLKAEEAAGILGVGTDWVRRSEKCDTARVHPESSLYVTGELCRAFRLSEETACLRWLDYRDNEQREYLTARERRGS